MAMRLDKYLAQAGVGTRSEVKKLIRSGRVFLNGTAAGRPEEKVEDETEVWVDGTLISCAEYEYFMLNKPAGVVSATKDARDKTVVDLITVPHAKELFPVGRLDKDTEGLLLLTDDGALAHQLLSPRKHICKTYLVEVLGGVTAEDIALLENGMDIGDDKPTKPARLADITYFGSETAKKTRLKITITEGRYHQIKRMFARVGKPVQYLKRLSMGSLLLDDSLALGAFRRLTKDEVERLKGKAH
jgi:16S rRNA pseudouridine516 synthase